MGRLTLLLLSTVLVPGLSSPLAPPGAPGYAVREVTKTTGRPPVGHEPSPTPAPVAHLDVRNGVPMQQGIGRREALNIGLSPEDTVIFEPIGSKGCTTTISETYGYPCSWDGTTTIYSSTTILFQPVNCNGCENVYVHKDYYFCPNQRIYGTRWAETPTTSWSTTCRPSAALRQRTEQATPATATDPGYGAPNPTAAS